MCKELMCNRCARKCQWMSTGMALSESEGRAPGYPQERVLDPSITIVQKKSYAFFMCMWIVYACVYTLCAVVWAQWHVWRPVEDAAWTPLELLEAGALTVPGVYHFSPSLVAGKSQWASCCDVTFPALGLPAHVWPSVTFHIGTGDPNSGPKHTVTH